MKVLLRRRQSRQVCTGQVAAHHGPSQKKVKKIQAVQTFHLVGGGLCTYFLQKNVFFFVCCFKFDWTDWKREGKEVILFHPRQTQPRF